MECGLCDAIGENRTIMENEYAVALITKGPIIDYHALIMPKRHITSFPDLKPDESKGLHDLVHELTTKIDAALETSTSAVINGAKHRTQQHIHYQVVPVYDGIRTILSKYLGGVPENQELSAEELSERTNVLREMLDKV